MQLKLMKIRCPLKKRFLLRTDNEKVVTKTTIKGITSTALNYRLHVQKMGIKINFQIQTFFPQQILQIAHFDTIVAE